MVRRLTWVVLAYGAIGAFAAAAIQIHARGLWKSSGNLVPRAARGSRVIGLTDTLTNVITSKPLWGSDVLARGGLDIVWGPSTFRCQQISEKGESCYLTFRLPRGCYAYPNLVMVYARHTYHWRQIGRDGSGFVRGSDGRVREYAAVVDELSGSSIGWAGPFGRTTPLRGKSSERLMPHAAQKSHAEGLTDTVSNITTTEPLYQQGGLICALGPYTEWAETVNGGPVRASLPFRVAGNYHTYATLVTTYRRHTYHWLLADNAGKRGTADEGKSETDHTAVVDEYAGSGLSWAPPIPNTVPWPVRHDRSM